MVRSLCELQPRWREIATTFNTQLRLLSVRPGQSCAWNGSGKKFGAVSEKEQFATSALCYSIFKFLFKKFKILSEILLWFILLIKKV
jgi:hypothetical protein